MAVVEQHFRLREAKSSSVSMMPDRSEVWRDIFHQEIDYFTTPSHGEYIHTGGDWLVHHLGGIDERRRVQPGMERIPNEGNTVIEGPYQTGCPLEEYDCYDVKISFLEDTEEVLQVSMEQVTSDFLYFPKYIGGLAFYFNQQGQIDPMDFLGTLDDRGTNILNWVGAVVGIDSNGYSYWRGRTFISNPLTIHKIHPESAFHFQCSHFWMTLANYDFIIGRGSFVDIPEAYLNKPEYYPWLVDSKSSRRIRAIPDDITDPAATFTYNTNFENSLPEQSSFWQDSHLFVADDGLEYYPPFQSLLRNHRASLSHGYVRDNELYYMVDDYIYTMHRAIPLEIYNSVTTQNRTLFILTKQNCTTKEVEFCTTIRDFSYTYYMIRKETGVSTGYTETAFTYGFNDSRFMFVKDGEMHFIGSTQKFMIENINDTTASFTQIIYSKVDVNGNNLQVIDGSLLETHPEGYRTRVYDDQYWARAITAVQFINNHIFIFYYLPRIKSTCIERDIGFLGNLGVNPVTLALCNTAGTTIDEDIVTATTDTYEDWDSTKPTLLNKVKISTCFDSANNLYRTFNNSITRFSYDGATIWRMYSWYGLAEINIDEYGDIYFYAFELTEADEELLLDCFNFFTEINVHIYEEGFYKVHPENTVNGWVFTPVWHHFRINHADIRNIPKMFLKKSWTQEQGNSLVDTRINF